MKTLKQFINESSLRDEYSGEEIEQIVLEYAAILDCDARMLTEAGKIESVKAGLAKAVGKLGLKVSGRKNLIHLIGSLSKNAALAMIHAMRAAAGDEGSKEHLEDLLQKSNLKSEFSDLILRLDILTLHFVTGPIHIIDAIMGWDLASNIREKTLTQNTKVSAALDELSKRANKMSKKASDRIAKGLKIVRKAFGLPLIK
jgi:hypothetical protein